MSWNMSVLCLVLIPSHYIAVSKELQEPGLGYHRNFIYSHSEIKWRFCLWVCFVLFLNMISMFAPGLRCFRFTLLGRLFLQHHLGVLLSCLCSLFWRLCSTKNFDGFIIPVIEYMLFLLFISMQSEHMADSVLDFVLFTLIHNKYEILV